MHVNIYVLLHIYKSNILKVKETIILKNISIVFSSILIYCLVYDFNTHRVLRFFYVLGSMHININLNKYGVLL